VNCEEFEELSGAYAIGALPDDERLDADGHLASCEKHPEVAELFAVANSLALAAPEMEPPVRLKARLMEAIAESEPVQQRSAPIRTPRRSLGEIISGWFRNARLGYGLAAAMTVLVVGLLAWNVSLQSEDDSGSTFVIQMTGQIGGEVVYEADQKVVFMKLQGVDQLPPDKVYEVWGLDDGRATALGVVAPTNGEVKAAMEFDADTYDAIAVTIEQAPGVDQPTTDPISFGEL